MHRTLASLAILILASGLSTAGRQSRSGEERDNEQTSSRGELLATGVSITLLQAYRQQLQQELAIDTAASSASQPEARR